MESLLCNEVWLSSPNALAGCSAPSFYFTKQDCEQAFAICLQKERGHLHSSNFNILVRYRVIQWFIKSRSRLNLSFKTVFNAANYFDRFISTKQCHEWKSWMVELLSVACLSVASKFTDTCSPSLHEIQMEDLDHSFESCTIQRMELIVLKALGWCLGSTTPYSYVELLTWNINHHLHHQLTARLTELLLGSLLDYKMMEFRECVVAASALKCSLEEISTSKFDAHLAYIARLIPQDQQVDLSKCQMLMKAQLDEALYNLMSRRQSLYCPSSPITVLTKQRIEIYDCHVDLSLFRTTSSAMNLKSSTRKRKWDEE